MEGCGKLSSGRRGGLPACVTLDAPTTRSKSHEFESLVSHPLKVAEGGSLSCFEGRSRQPPRPPRQMTEVRLL